MHLSRSSLYNTFGDKRTLFLNALKIYSDGVTSHIAQILHESPSAVVAIQTIFAELTAGAGTETGARGCFMINSIAELVPYDPDVTEIAAAYSNTLEQLFTETFTKAAAEGTVTNQQTPAQLSAYVFNTMQGLRILVKSGATRAQVEAVSAIAIKSLQ